MKQNEKKELVTPQAGTSVYVPPVIEVVRVLVERGMAGSTGTSMSTSPWEPEDGQWRP